MRSYLNGIFKRTPVCTQDIPQEELNIANKFRSNPLPWKGQFSPQLIEVLLSKYAQDSCHILDPFIGSGTALLEAATLGLEATGIELNPAAVALARIYEFCNLLPDERSDIARIITKALNSNKVLLDPLLTNTIETPSTYDVKQALLSIHEATNGNTFSKHLMETLIVLLDFYKNDITSAKVQSEWHKLKNLLKSLPYCTQKINVYQADARLIPLEDKTVDFIITSPPYINVFNYHQQYRASIESLDHGILKVAQSEIGSNRKHRSNRYLTVIQYCLDMALVLNELKRVSKDGAKFIFVVGRESSVRKTPFFNAEIVAEVAVSAVNLYLSKRQERMFVNRFGQSIYEDILHFYTSDLETEGDSLLEAARDVANKTLQAAKKVAPKESLSDLNDAINSIHDVAPSPYFEKTTFLKECVI